MPSRPAGGGVANSVIASAREMLTALSSWCGLGWRRPQFSLAQHSGDAAGSTLPGLGLIAW